MTGRWPDGGLQTSRTPTPVAENVSCCRRLSRASASLQAQESTKRIQPADWPDRGGPRAQPRGCDAVTHFEALVEGYYILQPASMITGVLKGPHAYKRTNLRLDSTSIKASATHISTGSPPMCEALIRSSTPIGPRSGERFAKDPYAGSCQPTLTLTGMTEL
ncbi:MAG: hypothetical protein JWN34_1283, partial [Bryobacterales bacterium]|nr:hypothetical protein [Bryobacterales bacterium]